MNYTVRPAGLFDLEIISKFTQLEAVEAEGQEKPDTTVRDGVRVALEDDSVAVYWVAEAKGEGIVGSVSIVKEWSDWHAANYWWVQSMYITPTHRGSGLMDLMLDEIKRAGKDEGALEIRLYINKANKRAIRAYEKRGFNDFPYKLMRFGL